MPHTQTHWAVEEGRKREEARFPGAVGNDGEGVEGEAQRRKVAEGEEEKRTWMVERSMGLVMMVG